MALMIIGGTIKFYTLKSFNEITVKNALPSTNSYIVVPSNPTSSNRSGYSILTALSWT